MALYHTIVRVNPNNVPVCTQSFTKLVSITDTCNLVVNFSSSITAATPLTVSFQNLSVPLVSSDSTIWSFGDGTSSYDVNPVHTYANAGTYVICLIVKKITNTTSAPCIRYLCRTITVSTPCNFNVNFNWHLDSVNNRKVFFNNLSTPPTASAIAVWSFGDGSTTTSWNAVHEYAHAGTFIVCLRVYLGSNSNCVREICDTIYIHDTLPACINLSNYHFERFSNDNQKYKFTSDYINSNLQYTWTFGDGTGSHDPIAIHRYTQAGNYTACLTVWRGVDCASTTCKPINVQLQVNCDSAHVSYTYQRNLQVPNKIQFFASGTLPILDQTWIITKIGGTVATPPVVLHQNNPIYLFQDTGHFRVCLRAVVLGGCVKEYCNYIRIENVSNVCELQAFPNPASTAVHVNVYLTQPEMIHAYVYNNLNALVLDAHQQGYTGTNLVSLNVSSLSPGQYIIRLVYGNRVCYARFQKL